MPITSLKKTPFKKAFLEILKNLSEKFSFEIPLGKYVWIPMTLQKFIQKPVKILRPILNTVLKQGYTLFFISNTFISNTRLKFEKSKQELSNTLRLNVHCLKIISHLHPRCHPKIIGDARKNIQKTSASVLWRYMFDDNENEAENEKYVKMIRHK